MLQVLEDSGKNDPSSLSLSLSLSLSQDQDDNDPTFSQPLYMTNITEDTTIGTVVTVITASDPDAGANGVVRYEFYPSVSNFVIDENTGTIRTAAKFNYETGPNSFTLNVSMLLCMNVYIA